MYHSLRKYLSEIKPVKMGVAALALIVLVIPVLSDACMLASGLPVFEKFSITSFMLAGYAKIFCLSLVYHAGYFICREIFKYFRS